MCSLVSGFFLSIKCLRFIRVISIASLCFVHCWVVFYCRNTPVCLFAFLLIVRLFIVWGSKCIPGSGTVGQQARCMCGLSVHCQIVFQNDYTEWEFLLFHILVNTGIVSLLNFSYSDRCMVLFHMLTSTIFLWGLAELSMLYGISLMTNNIELFGSYLFQEILGQACCSFSSAFSSHFSHWFVEFFILNLRSLLDICKASII